MTDKDIVKNFQAWVRNATTEGHGKRFTPDDWLESYLDWIGDSIAGGFCGSLDKIVGEAKQEEE